MKQLFSIITVAILLVSFSSCKKCFNCTKSDVACYDCERVEPTCGTCVSQLGTQNVCSDEQTYNTIKQACIAAQGLGAVWTETPGATTTASACGTSQDAADIKATLLTNDGFTCTKKTATTLNEDICGSNTTNAEGIKAAFETNGYTCTSK